jgi:hypothetical protein
MMGSHTKVANLVDRRVAGYEDTLPQKGGPMNREDQGAELVQQTSQAPGRMIW